MSNDRFERNTNTQYASWFLDLNVNKQLNLDPPYQRKSVWSQTYREFFIDSVIRNYPTQSVFLEIAVNADGPTEYKVLDGKQRLITLIKFTRDEFPAPDSLKDFDIQGKYYSTLPDYLKIQIRGYTFAVETIKEGKPTELNEIFNRLNRNVAKLNDQELRHAQFDGEFIRKMEALAMDPFWEQMRLFSNTRISRMGDVEYVSELYVLTAEGVQDGKTSLDKYYADWDDEIPNSDESNPIFYGVTEMLKAISKAFPLSGTKYGNLGDFYSLWGAISKMIKEEKSLDHEISAANLQNFIAELSSLSTERAIRYDNFSRQGINKLTNRKFRMETLYTVILQGQ
jgi:hypothetical protein